MRTSLLSLALVGIGSVFMACGTEDASEFGNGGGSSGASGASGGASSSGTGFGASSGTSGGGASSGTSGGNGNGETCDGLDNDGNGIIDDVDVGQDGICDCLRIATLGVKGTWGQGDVFATWLDGKSTNGAVDLAAQQLTPALLAKYQVIVAQDVSKIGRTYSAAEIAALGDWVKGGGGFLTLIGYGDPDERSNVNALLSTFGISYDADPILPKNGGSTIPVTTWAMHPVTSGVTKIGVDNGYEVAGAGTTLATEQGLSLLRALEVQKGHVLAWGDEWLTYNSEWVDHPDYQVARFWVNMIKWLTPAAECQVAIPAVVK